MSIVLDIILALILAICTFVGYKRGLVRSLSKLISHLISFTLANVLYVFLGRVAMKLFFSETVNPFSVLPFHDDMTFLDKIGDAFQLIKENMLVVGDAETMAQAKIYLDFGIAILISALLAFILTYIIIYLLLKLILIGLNGLITKLPVLKQVNGILGAIFGLLIGFFWTWALTGLFVQLLLPILTEKWPSVFVMEIADSVIVRLCTNINPITYLIRFINMIFH